MALELTVQGLEFEVEVLVEGYGLGLMVWGLSFKVECLGFRVYVLGWRV